MPALAYKKHKLSNRNLQDPRDSWGYLKPEVGELLYALHSGSAAVNPSGLVSNWGRLVLEAFDHEPTRTPLFRPSQPSRDSSISVLQQRLNNANRHFKRKAAEVFSDADAIRLLAELYESINLDTEEFDTCQHGIALAKLTAANFCEIGADVIYITEAGQRFIEALNRE